MFMRPKFGKENTDVYARTYMNGRIKYTGDTEATTDLEKRYKKPLKQLNDLIDNISARIKRVDGEKSSFGDNYVKKPELQIKMLEIISTLMSTQMNAIKNAASLHKEIREMELKERKLLHELTGKNMKMNGRTNIDDIITISDTMNAGFQNTTPAGVGGLSLNPLDNIPSYGKSIINDLKGEEPQDAIVTNSSATDVTPKSVTSEIKTEESQGVNIGGSGTQILEVDDRILGGMSNGTSGTTGLFSEIRQPEKSMYITNNNEYNQGVNSSISSSQAEVALFNKYLSKTVAKCHYDPETEYAWIRTHDTTTGEIVENEILTQPSLHGQIQIIKGSGTTYALDEREETFEIVIDKFENAPEAIKEELVNTYKK